MRKKEEKFSARVEASEEEEKKCHISVDDHCRYSCVFSFLLTHSFSLVSFVLLSHTRSLSLSSTMTSSSFFFGKIFISEICMIFIGII